MLGTLKTLAVQLDTGETSSVELTRACLRQVERLDTSRRIYLEICEDALDQAKVADERRASGQLPSDYLGIPISVKALFDVAGHVTSAGSRVLSRNLPASEDADVVARLKQAGFVVVGLTNMTEFAYSGLGINPHYGTPPNAIDEARIPGGSSSGAAVSVRQGMAAAGIGTDTGGSCRIPAAFNKLTGFKPTAQRISKVGVFPLSPTLDSVGSIAQSVDCCAALDAIMADEPLIDDSPIVLDHLKIGVLQNFVFDGVDQIVRQVFDASMESLRICGVTICDVEMPNLQNLPRVSATGGVVAHEAFAIHREQLKDSADGFDPRVRSRIEKGKTQPPEDVQEFRDLQKAIAADLDACLKTCDVIAFPTTPIVPPLLAELDDDDQYNRDNLLCLRNPTIANLVDGCSISLPVGAPKELPVGLCLLHSHMMDRRLLSIARAIERGLCNDRNYDPARSVAIAW